VKESCSCGKMEGRAIKLSNLVNRDFGLRHEYQT
jgi:hypothetical protein